MPNQTQQERAKRKPYYRPDCSAINVGLVCLTFFNYFFFFCKNDSGQLLMWGALDGARIHVSTKREWGADLKNCLLLLVCLTLPVLCHVIQYLGLALGP